MNIENIEVEALEICELEYEVAAVGSAEASESEGGAAAHYLIHFRQPEGA